MGLFEALASARSRQAAQTGKSLDLERLAIPQQLGVLRDRSREIALTPGRRGGKTGLGCLAPLHEAIEHPGCSCAYISTTHARAVDTVWTEMVRFLEAAGIRFTALETTRVISLWNGSRVWVTGVENKKQANKIRGRLRRTKLVFIDELQDWPSDLLRYFYDVVLWPTLADVGGRTIVAGTGSAPRGFWHGHTLKPSVSVHHWTMFDNPHIQDATATLRKALDDKGITATVEEVIACKGIGIDAEIAQEYFSQFVAGERQVFHLDRDRNSYDALPGGQWCYVIGCDWGTVDKTAVVVWGWSTSSPRLYLVAYETERGLSTHEQIRMVNRYVALYPPLAVEADPATGGSALILDLQDRFGTPAEAADKHGKVAAVMLLRDALRRGEVAIPAAEFDADTGAASGEFALALTTPEWDVEAVQRSLKGHMPDVCDAAIYGFRKCRQYDFRTPASVESEEDMVMRRMRENAREEERRVAEVWGEV